MRRRAQAQSSERLFGNFPHEIPNGTDRSAVCPAEQRTLFRIVRVVLPVSIFSGCAVIPRRYGKQCLLSRLTKTNNLCYNIIYSHNERSMIYGTA